MSDCPLVKMQSLASEKFDMNKISTDFLVTFIHNSLSFETDSITANDVKKIITGEVNNYDNKLITTVLNHKNALLFVIDLVKNDQELEENTLKDIHEILMDGLSLGGLYRNVDISIKGSNHTPPSHIKVYDRMKKYFETIKNFDGDLFELIAYSHLQLAKIHPFLDGNGRCSRLVLNYYLLKNGLAPIIIPHLDKKKYFELLEEFKVEKNIVPFINYLKDLQIKFLAA